MTMHLEGPWLSTTGKRRGKRKFRNADEARKARELAEQWEANKARWEAMSPGFSRGLSKTKSTVKINPVVSNAPIIDENRNTKRFPSVDTGAGSTAKAAPKVYTGTKIKGIGTMHKSNSVPIFSDEEAVAIAHMRR